MLSLIFISLKQNTSLLIEAQLKHGGNRTPELAAPTEGRCLLRQEGRKADSWSLCDQYRSHFSLQTQNDPLRYPPLPTSLAKGSWENYTRDKKQGFSHLTVTGS